MAFYFNFYQLQLLCECLCHIPRCVFSLRSYPYLHRGGICKAASSRLLFFDPNIRALPVCIQLETIRVDQRE